MRHRVPSVEVREQVGAGHHLVRPEDQLLAVLVAEDATALGQARGAAREATHDGLLEREGRHEVRLEDVVVDHRDVAPIVDVAGTHLLRIAELAEQLVVRVLEREHVQRDLVELGQFGVDAGFDDRQDTLGEPMAREAPDGCCLDWLGH